MSVDVFLCKIRFLYLVCVDAQLTINVLPRKYPVTKETCLMNLSIEHL